MRATRPAPARAPDQVSSLGELEFTDLSFLCETTSPSPFMSLNYYSEYSVGQNRP